MKIELALWILVYSIGYTTSNQNKLPPSVLGLRRFVRDVLGVSLISREFYFFIISVLCFNWFRIVAIYANLYYFRFFCTSFIVAQSNKRTKSNRGDTNERGELEEESERLAEQLKHKVNMSRYTKDKKEKVFFNFLKNI